jgi:hypothetical protein
MTATVADALNVARKYLGYNGGGTCASPNTGFGKWYGFQDQWCDMFISYVLAASKVGADPLGRHHKGYAWVPSHAQAYKDADAWVGRNGTIRPGDIVFYDWGGSQTIKNCDHIGIVEKVHDDNSFTAIEGNTDDPNSGRYSCGNCCRRKRRSRNVVVGFGRPAYRGTGAGGVRTMPTGHGVPAFPLPLDEFFGLITGPDKSHGGAYAFERPYVRAIQQRLQKLGYAPRTPGWADGIFEQPTADAVAKWQRAHMPGTEFFGEVWADDWAKLFR